MAEHNELGKAGENAAVAYLEEHGYQTSFFPYSPQPSVQGDRRSSPKM